MRQTTEDRIKQEYADQSLRLTEEYRKLEDLIVQMTQSEAGARKAQNGCVDVSLEQAYGQYLLTLEQRIQKTKERITVMETELKRQQDALIQARKTVKVLEKLRERRWAEYHKASERQEVKSMDDLTMMRRSLTPEV
jgi:flagellar FliJ protein